MNPITLQVDAKPDNPWVKDYIQLGGLWSDFAKTKGLQITGHITPYGMELDMTVKVDDYTFYISVRKKIENVKASQFSLKAWPISQVITVSFEGIKHKNHEVIVCSNNIWNHLKTLFKTYRNRQVIKNKLHCFNSNSIYEEIIDTGVTELDSFNSLQLTSHAAKLLILKIPNTTNEIKRVIQTCERIAMSIRNANNNLQQQ